MNNLKEVRKNPEQLIKSLQARGFPAPEQHVETMLSLYDKTLAEKLELEALRAERNVLAKRFLPENRERVLEINDQLGWKQLAHSASESTLKHALDNTPNILHPDVPIGKSELDNVEVIGCTHAGVRVSDHDHADMCKSLDFESGAALSGSRFCVMSGEIAKLHSVLARFMVDAHVRDGYIEHNVPLIVNESALYGTGQLPKFKDDLYCVGDGQYLIPTAEVPLTNLVANTKLLASNLPIKMVAHTPCFRKEAGSAGKDTHGLIRQHQFEKVELVQVVSPGDSETAHKEMLKSACSILDMLKLPYRVMELCSGDIGFSAMRTYDIEAWIPSSWQYREISSVSNCGDFQARRMNTGIAGSKLLPHTLNASGLAVGRTLVAVIENFTDDGVLHIPEVLVAAMGCETIDLNLN